MQGMPPMIKYRQKVFTITLGMTKKKEALGCCFACMKREKKSLWRGSFE